MSIISTKEFHEKEPILTMKFTWKITQEFYNGFGGDLLYLLLRRVSFSHS